MHTLIVHVFVVNRCEAFNLRAKDGPLLILYLQQQLFSPIFNHIFRKATFTMTKEASESQPLSTQTNDQKGPERNYSFNEFLKPTYLIVGTSIPMLIGAYAGYKSELSRATSSSYSPGFTSSGMGLLNRVVGEEIMASNKNNATKMAKAVASSAEHAQGPHVNIPRLAVKALGVGSLLSIGGFSFLTFGKIIKNCCEDLLPTTSLILQFKLL